jgi:hypothetical protein
MKNQAYFKRNFMPSMLGWFKMTPKTSVEDVEWLLARSAAYNAGFAFIANTEAIEKNGNSDKILELIGNWEKVRLANLFTDDQKAIMLDINTEFSLSKTNSNTFTLHRVNSEKFIHEKKVKQTGKPQFSTFNYNQAGETQPLNFIINTMNCAISNIIIGIDDYKKIEIPISLNPGEIIKYTGGAKAYVYNDTWNIINEFEMTPSDLEISEGNHSITFDCSFTNAGKGVKLEFSTFETAEKIVVSK